MLKMHNIKKVFRTDLVETHALNDFNLEVKKVNSLQWLGLQVRVKPPF